jgi:hypothetical protein
MKKLLIFCFACISTLIGFSQNPVQWSFSARKLADKKYEVHLNAIIQEPWHVYSQSTPEGGPLPTTITFGKNPLISLEGKARETGELHQVHDNTFDVDVKYFSGNVDFVQVVKVKSTARTAITGTVEFMACDDHQCLPPKTIPFTIQLK